MPMPLRTLPGPKEAGRLLARRLALDRRFTMRNRRALRPHHRSNRFK
jgi:hypothetical protein